MTNGEIADLLSVPPPVTLKELKRKAKENGRYSKMTKPQLEELLANPAPRCFREHDNQKN